jgi:predicted DNA-binding transcriptional regulator YafY
MLILDIHTSAFIHGMPITIDTLQRQWLTLRLIPRFPRKITGTDLTRKLASAGFSVTKRTVERDLQSLSAIFPLVSDTRAKPYGWSWERGAAALDVPALSPPEASSFLMLRKFLESLTPASVLDQLAPYFGMAEQCLNVQGGSAPLRDWLKKIAIVPANLELLPANVPEPILATVQEALLGNQQLKLRYRKRGERSDVEYIAHPLGLVQRGGVFYLVATLFDYDDTRLLVLHRIRHAEMLLEPATLHKNFSLAAYIADGNMGFGKTMPVDLVLRFTRNAGEHLWDTPLAANQQIVELPDGRVEVKARVADSLQLRWWLLGFADGVEVVLPTSLRQELRDRLRGALALYCTETQ